MSTQPGREGKSIVVSQDKDMKTLPTTVWDGKDLLHISEAEADYWHMHQTLVGDNADGYKGCPKIGPVKAEKILAADNPLSLWDRVVSAYEANGLTFDDALKQARLARILRWSDWSVKDKQPILWTPTR